MCGCGYECVCVYMCWDMSADMVVYIGMDMCVDGGMNAYMCVYMIEDVDMIGYWVCILLWI